MTRRWAITILAFLIVVLGGIAYRHWPRTVPWEECSALYRHYAHADGIEATFLRGYQVNDTLSIDVTLLQATDSAGWIALKKDFNMPIVENPIVIKAISRNKDVLSLIHTENIPAKTADLDVAVASKRDEYICIFHTANTEQKNIIVSAILDLITNSLKTKTKIITQ